jgi:hypothetical protein
MASSGPDEKTRMIAQIAEVEARLKGLVKREGETGSAFIKRLGGGKPKLLLLKYHPDKWVLQIEGFDADLFSEEERNKFRENLQEVLARITKGITEFIDHSKPAASAANADVEDAERAATGARVNADRAAAAVRAANGAEKERLREVEKEAEEKAEATRIAAAEANIRRTAGAAAGGAGGGGAASRAPPSAAASAGGYGGGGFSASGRSWGYGGGDGGGGGAASRAPPPAPASAGGYGGGAFSASGYGSNASSEESFNYNGWDNATAGGGGSSSSGWGHATAGMNYSANEEDPEENEEHPKEPPTLRQRAREFYARQYAREAAQRERENLEAEEEENREAQNAIDAEQRRLNAERRAGNAERAILAAATAARTSAVGVRARNLTPAEFAAHAASRAADIAARAAEERRTAASERAAAAYAPVPSARVRRAGSPPRGNAGGSGGGGGASAAAVPADLWLAPGTLGILLHEPPTDDERRLFSSKDFWDQLAVANCTNKDRRSFYNRYGRPGENFDTFYARVKLYRTRQYLDVTEPVTSSCSLQGGRRKRRVTRSKKGRKQKRATKRNHSTKFVKNK